MLVILISLFVIGWVAASVIGTQAYFRGEQTKPIHERNWKSRSFENIAKSVTGRDLADDRIPAFTIDSYNGQNLPTV